jgi:transposase-like protein
MQIVVKCPACNSESSFFVAKPVFQGPFRCWKCKALFTLKAKNSEIQLLEPLTQENFDKQKAAKDAKKKAKEKAG